MEELEDVLMDGRKSTRSSEEERPPGESPRRADVKILSSIDSAYILGYILSLYGW